jgi:hypothetical protein
MANPARGAIHQKDWPDFPPKSDIFPAKQLWSVFELSQEPILEKSIEGEFERGSPFACQDLANVVIRAAV